MLYKSGEEWKNTPHKRVLVFGMSGLGKSYLSNMLRFDGDWFHYSVDYRIGTRYMGEHIVDNFKKEAMKTPFLADLLKSDSIYIGSNITFDNLAPLATYLGKPGREDRGGLRFSEYMRRQEQHRIGEIAAMQDTSHFIHRASALYGYQNFICDSSGSFCEVVNPNDPDDALLKALSEDMLLLWIEGSDDHTKTLIERFRKAPKPMYYAPEVLNPLWERYKAENDLTGSEIDPDAFIIWAYGEALTHRQPRYRAIAENWGVSISADKLAKAQNPAQFEQLIADAIDNTAR